MAANAMANDKAGQDILRVAAQVFGRLGYKKTSVQDIVVAANVSRPLFYRRFRDKQHVFSIVVDQMITEWNLVLVEAVANAGDETAVKLKALQDKSLEFAVSRSLLHQLLTRDAQFMLSAETDVTDRGVNALKKLIETILKSGVARGEVRADLPIGHMVDFVAEIHLAYATRAVAADAPLDRGLIASVTACLLHGVMASRTD